MRLNAFLRFLGVAFVFLVIPVFSAAQQSVTCEANNENRKYCGSYDPDQVRLDRQISGSPCIEGRTWGVDRQGLWVERGCRAIFIIRVRDDRPDYSVAQENITCEANNENRKYCGSYDPDQVRLDRQISGSPCIEGRTWGVDRQGLWVERGCRAVFVILSRERYDHDRDHDRDRDDRDRRGWWDPEPDATWPPRGDWHGGRWERGGACFYKERDFSGGFFCLRRGESRESLGEFGGKISSIRVFGDARVTVYDERDFRGASASLDQARPDLHDWRVRQKPDHTWNDRISSIQVE